MMSPQVHLDSFQYSGRSLHSLDWSSDCQIFPPCYQTVQNDPIIICIIVSLFSVVLKRSISVRFLSFSLYVHLARENPIKKQVHVFVVNNNQQSFFCLFLAENRIFACNSKSLRIVFVSFFRKDSGLCTYQLIVWWDFNYLPNVLRISSPTLSRLVL